MPLLGTQTFASSPGCRFSAGLARLRRKKEATFVGGTPLNDGQLKQRRWFSARSDSRLQQQTGKQSIEMEKTTGNVGNGSEDAGARFALWCERACQMFPPSLSPRSSPSFSSAASLRRRRLTSACRHVLAARSRHAQAGTVCVPLRRSPRFHTPESRTDSARTRDWCVCVCVWLLMWGN